MTLPISKHRLWQVAVDAALIAAAWYLAFQLRFDKGVPIYYRTLFERSVGIVIVVQLVTFVCFGFYNRWWRYVSTRDMWGAARGVAVACVLSSLVLYFANLVPEVGLPRSIAIMDFLLLLAFVAGARMLVRTLLAQDARQVVGRSQHADAVDAQVARLRVVVDEADRRVPE